MRKYIMYGIVLIVIIVIFFIISAIITTDVTYGYEYNISDTGEIIFTDVEKIRINQELNSNINSSLIRKLSILNYNGDTSNNMVTEQITEDGKIVYTYEILKMTDYNISQNIQENDNSQDNDNDKTIEINKNYINTNVKKYFGEEIDFNNVSFDTTDETVTFEYNDFGGDVIVYKIKNMTYNSSTKQFTIVIDRLLYDPSDSSLASLVDPRVVEYDESSVCETITLSYQKTNSNYLIKSYKIEVKQ